METAENLDLFVAVVDAGSISAAARELGLPRATLSRHLAKLEERLQVRLLHRSSRQLKLTRAGNALYPRARMVMEAADAAVQSVGRLDDTPRGLLRISSAPLDTLVLGSLVGEFLQRYPEVEVELHTSTRHIDLAAEQIDVALRGGVVRDPNLIARPLLHSEMIAVASPKYLERRGVPSGPSDLSEHACLRGFQAGSRPATTWPLRDGGKVRVRGPFVTNDLNALAGATTHGLGIALLPRELAQERIATGQLRQILSNVVGLDVSLSLVWVEREYLDPKVRAFVDLASQWSAEKRLIPHR